MKKKLFINLTLLFCFLSLASFAKDFTISPAKQKNQRSKNSLKEDIGFNMKDALNYCTVLNRKIGEMQIKLADVQKNLLAKIEDLLNNKAQFKKAKHGELKSTLDIMKESNKVLDVQINNIKDLQSKMDGNFCLKKTT